MPIVPPMDMDGDGDLDTGAMAIWAMDFIASAVTDCSEPVSYVLGRAQQDPDTADAGLVLTCDDPATVIVRVWASDAVGNRDYCVTYILVFDPFGACPS